MISCTEYRHFPVSLDSELDKLIKHLTVEVSL